jgi:hypothetical protein
MLTISIKRSVNPILVKAISVLPEFLTLHSSREQLRPGTIFGATNETVSGLEASTNGTMEQRNVFVGEQTVPKKRPVNISLL